MNTGDARHIAIVMDGNGRWASKRYLPRIAGHRQGVESLRKIVAACPDLRIDVLTVFAFSSENWRRPAEEVSALFDILVLVVAKDVPNLQRDGVRIRFIGSRIGLSNRILSGLEEAENRTRDNSKLELNICFNYGGRWDIATAASRLAKEGVSITEESLSSALATAPSRDPDLLIRTGNEKRLSNFLLWQCAYAELFFTETLWPDFDVRELRAILQEFELRERRYGQTPEQLALVRSENSSS